MLIKSFAKFVEINMSAKVKGGTMRWFYLKGLNTQYPLNPSVTSTKVPKVYRLTDKQAVGVKGFTDESFQTLELVTGEKVKTRTWKKEYKLLQVQKGFVEGEIISKEIKEVVDGWVKTSFVQVVKRKWNLKPIEQQEVNLKEISSPHRVKKFVEAYTRNNKLRSFYRDDYKRFKIRKEYEKGIYYYLDMENMFYFQIRKSDYWLVCYDNNNINHQLFKEWLKEFKKKEGRFYHSDEELEVLKSIMEEIYIFKGKVA